MTVIAALWACLIALALGREWILGHSGLSSSAVAAWLGLLALPMLRGFEPFGQLRHPWLGVQRAMAGGISLLGIYGGIAFLGAPLSVALGLLDTLALFAREPNRRGRWPVTAAIVGFIVQACWDLRHNPHDLAIGLAWAAFGIVGRVWNYLSWQAQHDRDETPFWVLALPLGGSALAGALFGGPFLPAHWSDGLVAVVLLIAGLGLLAYFVENKVVRVGGALNARLSEITVLPMIWIGHWLMSPVRPSASEGAFGLAAALAAGWALSNAPVRTPAQ